VGSGVVVGANSVSTAVAVVVWLAVG